MRRDIKKIYIVHQYYDESHFKALYDCCNEYEYSIEQYIILDKFAIVKKMLRRIIRNKELFIAIKDCISDFKNLFKLKFLKNEVLIVGIAPYDRLLNKYTKIFQSNKSIYFTSWQYWDGINFPRGDINNKEIFESLLSKSFKGAACVSQLTASQVEKFICNTAVVNHAININEYNGTGKIINNSVKKYIFMGAFNERKNVKLILNWLCNNLTSELKFYFAGTGDLKEEIVRLSQEDRRITYMGILSKQEIKQTLNKFDFLVLPSKEEPFGIVLLEALAAGVPCIVSDSFGPREIIEDNYNGFMFDKNSKEEFDLVMKKSLRCDEKEYLDMRRNCLESSQKYDSKYLIKKWNDIIEKCIDEYEG